jgi:hypothetical protein
MESKLIFASDGIDFLRKLGSPMPYIDGERDCEKFYQLFTESRNSLTANTNSKIFNLSSLFLSIRNIATCYSLSSLAPVFSRNAAFIIDIPTPLRPDSYILLERARILATRGIGEPPTDAEISELLLDLDPIEEWMHKLILKVRAL